MAGERWRMAGEMPRREVPAVKVALFAYGTLMRKRRLEALVGERLPEPVPAILRGYRKYDTGQGYPIILPDKEGWVEGVIWEVPAEALPAIDHYEGADEDPPYYVRREAVAEVAGRQVPVQVYVGNPAAFPHLRPLGPGEPPARPTPTA